MGTYSAKPEPSKKKNNERGTGFRRVHNLKPRLVIHPCFSARMAVTEVKEEPVEYEETVLTTLNKIPLNKVSMLILC